MDRLSNIYNELSIQLISKTPVGRQQKISIATAAVALAVAYLVHKALTPPARLRHLPYVGLFTYLNALMRRKLISEISRDVTLPVGMKSPSGVYARFDQNGWSVHITRPEAAKKFLLKTDIFAKLDVGGIRGGTLLGRFVFQRNILVLNGHEWRAQRKIANPAFHRSMPVELFGKLTQKVFNAIGGAESETINFHRMTERFTLDAIGLAGFDFDFHAVEDPNSEWVIRYRDLMDAGNNPWFFIFYNLDMKYRFLFPSRVRVHRELDIFLGMMDEIIAHKRQILNSQQSKVPESERDLLTLMIEAENSGEGSMTNKELRQFVSLFPCWT
ncbi:cytochrome P450 [Lichtheimia hyalospora FSU 10163]|nr:cytochrome P450 [Lichtheimia hyalospora FSU 10163]